MSAGDEPRTVVKYVDNSGTLIVEVDGKTHSIPVRVGKSGRVFFEVPDELAPLVKFGSACQTERVAG